MGNCEKLMARPPGWVVVASDGCPRFFVFSSHSTKWVPPVSRWLISFLSIALECVAADAATAPNRMCTSVSD